MINFDKSTGLIHETSENVTEDVTDECLLAIVKHLDFIRKNIDIIAYAAEGGEKVSILYEDEAIYSKKYINELKDKIKDLTTLIRCRHLYLKDNFHRENVKNILQNI